MTKFLLELTYQKSYDLKFILDIILIHLTMYNVLEMSLDAIQVQQWVQNPSNLFMFFFFLITVIRLIKKNY